MIDSSLELASHADKTKIVRPSFASLSNGRAIRASIPANHGDMCKFVQKDDVGYQRVMDMLRKICIDKAGV